MEHKRFRIAFSFAGEKREFVAKVAAILARQFGKERILYDKFHRSEFSRSDLAFYLSDLYEKEAELVIVIFSPDYEKKEWCGLEWNTIFGLLKKRNASEVMLTRFERVEGQGLRGLAGYTDLDELTPEQAASAILERLAINEGRHQDYYAASQSPNASVILERLKVNEGKSLKYAEPVSTDGKVTHTSIPNNLPRLQPFFGREAELAQIREALDPDNRTWGALIDGPGGIGKTSLAVRAAYDCTPEQFKHIVFVSVKNRELDDDGVRELRGFILPGFLEMLNELSRELGRADITKAPEGERIRLLLDALHDEQALLVLDNLESLPEPDRDRLFTFVKHLPRGCKAILTSRRRISSGSEELILEKISQEAALETLADLARRKPLLAKTNEAERIALHEQTAGNPLLLRWMAEQFGRGSCRTLADALASLRSCPEDNDPLEFIFGDLVNEFTEDETKVLCALAYFTLPAKVEHVATVASCDEDSVETALRGLANRSLVVPDTEEMTFALMPMVADFLRRRKPEVIAYTGDQLEERAYTLVVEKGYQDFGNFPMLDAAWPTVAAALPRFLAGPNDRLQTVCGALHDFLDFTGRWDEWLILSRDAEVKAIAAKDFWSAGWRAYDAGWVHNLRRQSVEVFACADRAEAHWREAEAGVRERAIAIRLRGTAHKLVNDYPAAISAYREAVELDRTLKPAGDDIVSGLNDLAESELLSGDLDAAERDFRESLRIALVVNHREAIATLTGNLAEVALKRGDWPNAEALARKALLLAEKVGRKELIASDCHDLAEALARQGQMSEALPYAQRAVEIFTVLRDPELEAARRTLAECGS